MMSRCTISTLHPLSLTSGCLSASRALDSGPEVSSPERERGRKGREDSIDQVATFIGTGRRFRRRGGSGERRREEKKKKEKNCDEEGEKERERESGKKRREEKEQHKRDDENAACRYSMPIHIQPGVERHEASRK
ncbi:hypothetical protein PUN28_006357 [Cardiocondyla obscurior]|uniref:Uncharacterized protein n=1 Tax=Cardiocondyla obscurior TaxID=286306 RepID=A0AAW2GA22_9HYME